jgi:hypothetical protein
MAKPDGRIEKGQRLGSAISARAWNRAQDAADIVLGVRPGVSVPESYQPIDHLTVRVPATALHIPTDPLQVGHGIALNDAFQDPGGMSLITSLPQDVQNESDLPQYQTDLAVIRAPTSSIGVGVRCGIIESVSELTPQDDYICRVRVRGLVRCRVLFLTVGASVGPPPPKPTHSPLIPYWRRYLMATDYGRGTILALGARYRLNGTNNYPCIQEALVYL